MGDDPDGQRGGGADESTSQDGRIDDASRDLRGASEQGRKAQRSLGAALAAAAKPPRARDRRTIKRIHRYALVASGRMALASRSATRAAVLLGFFGPIVALWRSFVAWVDRVADRKTRIAMAMAAVATLSAIAAYRASDEERKSSMCEHQLAEAQTYELIQRQRYLDATIAHNRLSDRYEAGLLLSDRLHRQAQALREPGKPNPSEPDPGGLDVEAQLDLAVVRTVEPVRDFTDPNLPPRSTVERSLRARAEQDIRELGIPKRCAVNDDSRVETPPGLASNPKNEGYLESLRRHVEQLHAKSLSDAFAVVAFVVVLVLFTLSEVFAGNARRVFEILASAGTPLSFAYAILQNDEGMKRYLSATLLFLFGFFAMSWVTMLWLSREDTSEASNAPQNGGPVHRWIWGLLIATEIALGAAVLRARFDVGTGSTRVGPIFLLLLIFMALAFVVAWVTVEARRSVPARHHRSRLDHVATGALLTFAVLVPCVPLAAFAVKRESFTWLWAFEVGAVVLGSAVLIFVAISLSSLKNAPPTDRSVPPLEMERVEPPPEAASAAAAGPDEEHHVEEIPEVSTEGHEVSAGRHIRLRTVHEAPGAWVVAAIAITALFSAILTALYADETAIASRFASKAAEEQLDLMRSSSRLAAQTYRTIDGLVELSESWLRVGASEELRDRAVRQNTRDAVAIWEHEARHWQSAAEIATNRVAVDPADESASVPLGRLFHGPNGPDNDPAFPAKLFITATVQTSAERLALWDAYDERATASEGRADVLLGGATLFAIALYLFGQSLGMGATSRGGGLLAMFGTGVLLFGIVLGVKALWIPVPPVDELVTLPEACRSNDEELTLTRAEAAAKCYGFAEAILALANDAGAYNRAHEAYETATLQSLRPGFTLARYRSVRATSEVTTTQSDVRHVSIVPPKELAKIVDVEKAIIADLERRERYVPATLRQSFGFHEYLLALDSRKRSLLDDAIAILRKADDASEEGDGLVRFRLAVALLAQHNPESSRTYDLALNSHVPNDEIRATAITDLEVLRTSCQRHHFDTCPTSEEIDERESSIVRAMKSSEFERKLPRHNRLTASLTPEGIRWKLLTSSRLDAMPTSLIVYRWDRVAKLWYVIPAASGVLDRSEIIERSPRRVTGFRHVLTRPHEAQCLETDGEYSVELRVGGTRLERAPAPAPKLAHFGRAVLREQGIALCVPDGADGWTRTATAANRLKAGYRAKDGAAGVNLYAMFAPRDAHTMTQRSFLTHAIDDTLREIQGRGLDGRDVRPARRWCSVAPQVPSTVQVAYVMPQLQILAQAWPARDGLLHAAILWSPSRATSLARTACRVRASMTSIDTGAGSISLDF